MSLRELLRPLTETVGVGIRRAQFHLVRAPAWDGVHHPIFESFVPWSGTSDGTRVLDFLGGRTDPRFRMQFRPTPIGEAVLSLPVPSASYFEWIALLQAVVAARSRFVMVELGAGYGPWLASAWLACVGVGSTTSR